MKKKHASINQPDLLTRRQTLMTLSTILGGGALATTAYADFVSLLLGRSGKEIIDKSVSPSSSLIAVNGSDGKSLQMRTNGVPDHATGMFPGPHCPEPIRPVTHVFQIPRNPQASAIVTPLENWLFGVALNGVVFDQSGPYWQSNPALGWHYEVMSTLARVYLGLDFTNAHVQTTGEYHYHGRCVALEDRLTNLKKGRGESIRMILVGFAADGFPVYAPNAPKDPRDLSSPIVELRSSYQLKAGNRPSTGPGKLIEGTTTRDYQYDGTFVQDYEYVSGLGDLDECNGRFGVTDEYPQGTYYYVMTNAFPFLSRYFRGTPDKTFSMAQPGQEQRSGVEAPVPPQLKKLFG